MKKQLIIACCLLMGAAQWAAADTVGYWRFEDGPGPVTKPYGAIDSSGNGYHMDPWTAGDWAGFEYRTDVAGSVLEVDGVYLPNQYSIKNTGGYPGMATEPGAGIQSITPAAFTIEATFKLENGGYKTIVGRDSQGSVTQGENPNADLAALYFQTVPNNGLAIKFCDVSGYWHEAISAENVYIGFDFSSNPDGLNTPWYSMAGVSDGQTLSLYLRNVTAGEDWRLIAQTDLTASGSPNTALTAGTGQGSDWYAGSWSIGRGLYAGGHTDRGYGFIDEVRISDAALSPQEFIFVDSRLGAWNPSPADGAANVGVSPDGQTVTVELSWNTGIDPDNPSQLNATILSHSLYMSPDQTKTEDPNLYWVADFPVEGPTAQTTIEQLYFDGLYYWRVDEGIDDGTGNPYPAGDPNNITGRVWTFETRVSRPVFILQPISQVVDAGDTVELAVEAESISAVQYRWYKSADNVADPENDVAITDLGDYAILVLEDVQVADEGYYYCQAVNQAGIDRAAYSDVVTVGIRRKVAHWTMDQADYVGGQYLDISGEGHHADPNGTPTFVEGQLGEAVAIYREFGDPPSTDSWARAGHWNPSEFSGQLTVSFWLKWAGLNGTWQSLISKRSGDFNNENVLWQISTDNGLPHLWFQSPRSLIAVNNGLVPDQWLHIVVTFDGTDGTIYINGEQRAKGGFQFGDAVEAAICLGGNSFDVGPREWVNGDLDDVQFFNYALSDLDIAVMYNAITGEDVCVQSQRPDAQFDLNDDCIVDIQDFAILVQNWLECGLISCAD
jgi:hypothetical protein